MTPEAQRIAIAEACGWTNFSKSESPDFWYAPRERYKELCRTHRLPDYLNDLNAMHEAIILAAEQGGFEFQAVFQLKLQEVIERRRSDLNREQIGWWMNNATAAQRAEAFLRVKGLWK